MYEILYIIPTPYTEQDVPVISKKIRSLIEKAGGKILKEEELGNKKLAYPIKHIYRGFYNLFRFEIETKEIKGINEAIRLTPEILRHMIVTLNSKPMKIRKPRHSMEKKEEEIKEVKEEEKTTVKTSLKDLEQKIDDLF
ncbi:MAG: 30S ribosomal protein S6 [Patescibacteria group bacterium]